MKSILRKTEQQTHASSLFLSTHGMRNYIREFASPPELASSISLRLVLFRDAFLAFGDVLMMLMVLMDGKNRKFFF